MIHKGFTCRAIPYKEDNSFSQTFHSNLTSRNPPFPSATPLHTHHDNIRCTLDICFLFLLYAALYKVIISFFLSIYHQFSFAACHIQFHGHISFFFYLQAVCFSCLSGAYSNPLHLHVTLITLHSYIRCFFSHTRGKYHNSIAATPVAISMSLSFNSSVFIHSVYRRNIRTNVKASVDVL